MNARPSRIGLSCPHCAARTVCGPDEMLRRLQSLGMLRREKHPDAALVAELFRSSLDRLPCSACGRTGLKISPAADARDDDDAWGGARRCESCGCSIPPERLQLLPRVTLCVACQRTREAGASDTPIEYCARCGSILRTRLRPGDGLARYEPYCPQCRR